jgi:hypothetical protein
MRYAFVLLALIVGTVCGDEISARIEGITADESYCSTSVFDSLYDECVVEKAVDLGASFDRRLELRGSRDVQRRLCSYCPQEAIDTVGHWCYVKCGTQRRSRRLTLANEHPNRRLTNQGEIQKAARDCYEEKRGMSKYKCLGESDIQVFIVYSQN